MNIWHTLAENALDGKFSSNIEGPPVSCCGLNNDEGYRLFHFMRKLDGESFYSDLTPSEQCLFLLFCGESYESQR